MSLNKYIQFYKSLSTTLKTPLETINNDPKVTTLITQNLTALYPKLFQQLPILKSAIR